VSLLMEPFAGHGALSRLQYVADYIKAPHVCSFACAALQRTMNVLASSQLFADSECRGRFRSHRVQQLREDFGAFCYHFSAHQ
jgi:hypothetical protein